MVPSCDAGYLVSRFVKIVETSLVDKIPHQFHRRCMSCQSHCHGGDLPARTLALSLHAGQMYRESSIIVTTISLKRIGRLQLKTCAQKTIPQWCLYDAQVWVLFSLDDCHWTLRVVKCLVQALRFIVVCSMSTLSSQRSDTVILLIIYLTFGPSNKS